MQDYFYTYVLRSLKDNNFYTGYTKNIKLRFEQHNNGLVESTKNRTPFELIYFEACLNREMHFIEKNISKHFTEKCFLKAGSNLI